MRPDVPPDPRVVADRRDDVLPRRPVRQVRRRPGARQLEQPAGATREHAGSDGPQVRRVDGEGEHGRQPRQDRLQRREAALEALHADVDVHAAHQLPTSLRPLGEHREIPLLLDDVLLLRLRERMSAGRRDDEPLAGGRLRDHLPQALELRERLERRLADRRVRLDEAGEELRLQPRRPEQALDAAGERERLGVEEHELLLDAERQVPAEALCSYLRRTPCTGRPEASQA